MKKGQTTMMVSTQERQKAGAALTLDVTLETKKNFLKIDI
jgi:hypothetical protein